MGRGRVAGGESGDGVIGGGGAATAVGDERERAAAWGVRSVVSQHAGGDGV